ncbi:hypothetical protein [Bacillus dakarensis]|uniref:hypothetical protein n=1 Tax=Robertmurraya dakarensis TaxID=1926278 RepID=UPI0009815379|nr:hypothetical protein [Bacillus dakarensis]
METKKLYIANFNCTFGKDNKPMLEHFLDIILPAFQKDLVRKDAGNQYLFEKVHLIMSQGEFMLAGLLVKRTQLEIKSRYKEGEGLKRTNEKILSDPYSYFLISLKNHRMTLVKNQKGSPDIRSFSATARNVLYQYIKDQNNKIEKPEDKLPKPNLNVVPIPFEGEIDKALKDIRKINKLTLRFYPLNGDISHNKMFNALRDTLIEVGSNTGFTQINTPENHKEVANLLKETKGLVKPTLYVIDGNGNKKTLRDDSFTESMDVSLDEEESLDENINSIAGKVTNREEFTETSSENTKIYQKFFSSLMSVFSNK